MYHWIFDLLPFYTTFFSQGTQGRQFLCSLPLNSRQMQTLAISQHSSVWTDSTEKHLRQLESSVCDIWDGWVHLHIQGTIWVSKHQAGNMRMWTHSKPWKFNSIEFLNLNNNNKNPQRLLKIKMNIFFVMLDYSEERKKIWGINHDRKWQFGTRL